MGIDTEYTDEDDEVIEIQIDCSKCTYFEGQNVFKISKGEKIRVGKCHRAPPNQDGEFAKTYADNWCGEFYLKQSSEEISTRQ